MKSILVHIERDNGLEGRLQVVLDLARCFDAHLSCLQVVNYEVAMPGDFYGSATASVLHYVREQAAELREKTERDLANEDVRWDWIEEVGVANNRLIEFASINDLVVLGKSLPGHKAATPSYLIGTLAIHARTPLLVVPEKTDRLDCTGPALVCWDGSVEAANALRAAVPLLRLARKVCLVTVTDAAGGGCLPPLSGADYLARHGIECEMVAIPSEGRATGDVLLTAAELRKADYLVMGAYGRPRLLEGLFGGVTRQLLSDPPVPLFAAH